MRETAAAKEKSDLSVAVDATVARLRRIATKKTLHGMARYGIPQERAVGVSVAHLHIEAKRIGRNHELALALWKSGWYEARMLAVFIEAAAEDERSFVWKGMSWALRGLSSAATQERLK